MIPMKSGWVAGLKNQGVNAYQETRAIHLLPTTLPFSTHKGPCERNLQTGTSVYDRIRCSEDHPLFPTG